MKLKKDKINRKKKKGKKKKKDFLFESNQFKKTKKDFRCRDLNPDIPNPISRFRDIASATAELLSTVAVLLY